MSSKVFAVKYPKRCVSQKSDKWVNRAVAIPMAERIVFIVPFDVGILDSATFVGTEMI